MDSEENFVALCAQVDEALKTWRQGDVVDIQWFAHGAVGKYALTDVSANLELTDTVQFVRTKVEGLVLTSQSCDIQDPAAEQPYLEFAPLVRLTSNASAIARKGFVVRYTHVPEFGEDAFADLDRIMTLEKGAVWRFKRTHGCSTDEQRRVFAKAAGRKRGRSAFPNDLAPALDGLRKRFQDKHGKQSLEGRAMESIQTVLAKPQPDWDSDDIEVFLTFCPSTLVEALDVGTTEQWSELVNGWIERCSVQGVITAIDGVMIPLEEITALELMGSDQLDLRYLSN